MTDRTFTATELREVLGGEGTAADKVQALHELILFPSRPTLADMTDEERAACQWMQADVKGYESRVVIVNPFWEDGLARVMWLHTRMNPVPWKSVTPRPDLPLLTWPGEQQPAPAPALPDGWRLADHQKYGRVLVVRIFGDKAIYATPHEMLGIHTHVSLVSDLTFVDQGDDTPTGPNTLAVGDVIESAADPRLDALPDGSVLRDCNGETVAKRHVEWVGIGYIPIPSEGAEFGPWTVLHIPKGADQ